MGAAAISFPLIGDQGPGEWGDFIEDAHLEHTLLTAFGAGNAWVAIAPVVLAAARGRRHLRSRGDAATALRDLPAAAAPVIGWAAVAVLAPSLTDSPNTPLDGDENAALMVAMFARRLADRALALGGPAGAQRRRAARSARAGAGGVEVVDKRARRGGSCSRRAP